MRSWTAIFDSLPKFFQVAKTALYLSNFEVSDR